MLEHLHSVDEDHRNIVAVAIAKRRIIIDVDFFQHEMALTTGAQHRFFRNFTEVTSRPRKNCDCRLLHLLQSIELSDKL